MCDKYSWVGKKKKQAEQVNKWDRKGNADVLHGGTATIAQLPQGPQVCSSFTNTKTPNYAEMQGGFCSNAINSKCFYFFIYDGNTRRVPFPWFDFQGLGNRDSNVQKGGGEHYFISICLIYFHPILKKAAPHMTSLIQSNSSWFKASFFN